VVVVVVAQQKGLTNQMSENMEKEDKRQVKDQR
jgi:hypothetical protein